MSERGNIYRRKAKYLFAKAEENDDFREEYQDLAMAFLRLAAYADCNSQTNPPEQKVRLVREGQRERHFSSSNNRPPLARRTTSRLEPPLQKVDIDQVDDRYWSFTAAATSPPEGLWQRSTRALRCACTRQRPRSPTKSSDQAHFSGFFGFTNSCYRGSIEVPAIFIGPGKHSGGRRLWSTPPTFAAQPSASAS
jgi:hypothetical protein